MTGLRVGKRGPRRGLVDAAVWLSVCSAALLDAQDPPLTEHYDKVILKTGQVYYAHPRWSGSRARPVAALQSLGQLLFVPYDTGAAGRTLSCKSDEIQDLRYWEQMVTEQIQRHHTAGEFAAARALFERLQKEAPLWDPAQLARLAKFMQLARVRELCAAGRSAAERDQGLRLLEDLMQQSRDLPGLETLYSEIYLQLARSIYQQGNYRQARDYVDKVSQYFGQNDMVQKALERMQRDAQAHLAKATALKREGRFAAAIEEALTASEIWPKDPQAAALREELMVQYQMLRVAAYEKPGTFEPCNASRPLEKQIVSLLFDRLVEADEDGRQFIKGPLTSRYLPMLLGRRLEFELRPLTFSDGTVVAAQDAAETIRLLKDPRREAFDPEWDKFVLRTEVLGPRRLAIDLRQHPRPESLFTIPILPSRYLHELPQRGDGFSTQPVGSGPFVVAGPDARGHVRLTANTRFRGAAEGRPYIKEIAFPYYVQRGTGAAANDLEQGKVHVIADPSPIQLVRLQNVSHLFRTRPFQANSVWVLVFNFRRPLFARREAREAMLLAISREHILRQYFSLGGGHQFTHTVISGPFPPQSNACDVKLAPRPHDPVVAAGLVRGLGDLARTPLSLKFANYGDLPTEQAMVQVKKDLETAGFNVRLDPKLPNDFMKEVAHDHDFDLAYWRIDHNILCNIAGLFDIANAALEPGGANFMGCRDQTLNQLFIDLRNEQVGDKIWSVQHRIHRYIYDQVLLIPLWRLDTYVAYTTRLKGRSGGKSHELPIDQSTLFRRTEEWYLEPK